MLARFVSLGGVGKGEGNLIFIQGVQTQDVKCVLSRGSTLAPFAEAFKAQVLGRVHFAVAESSLRPKELFIIHI